MSNKNKMEKTYRFFMLVLFILIIQATSSFALCKYMGNCYTDNEYFFVTNTDFKIGDCVVFKKNESGPLYQGKILGINQSTAVLEYIDPAEPTKVKEIEIEFSRLTKVNKVEVKSDLEMNMPIIFKKVNSEQLWEGVVTGINQSSAIIEYTDTIAPSKIKEVELDFTMLFIVDKEILPATDAKLGTDQKGEMKISENSDFIKGDKVQFIMPHSRILTQGEIIKLNDKTATVEYKGQMPPFIKNQIDIDYDKIKKKEPENKIKTIKEKSKVDFMRNTFAIDPVQIPITTISIWYEYKVKELIGLRIPVYFDWKAIAVYGGINPKFYFNRNKTIQGFAGPELFFGINRNIRLGNTVGSIFISVLADAGISINPVKNFNITANCGFGIQEHYNWSELWFNYTYSPEISFGYKF